jgi:hypothetical protein
MLRAALGAIEMRGVTGLLDDMIVGPGSPWVFVLARGRGCVSFATPEEVTDLVHPRLQEMGWKQDLAERGREWLRRHGVPKNEKMVFLTGPTTSHLSGYLAGSLDADFRVLEEIYAGAGAAADRDPRVRRCRARWAAAPEEDRADLVLPVERAWVAARDRIRVNAISLHLNDRLIGL